PPPAPRGRGSSGAGATVSGSAVTSSLGGEGSAVATGCGGGIGAASNSSTWSSGARTTFWSTSPAGVSSMTTSSTPDITPPTPRYARPTACSRATATAGSRGPTQIGRAHV